MRGAQTECWATARSESGSDGQSGGVGFRKRAQRCYLLARGLVFASALINVVELAACKTLASPPLRSCSLDRVLGPLGWLQNDECLTSSTLAKICLPISTRG